MFPDTLYCQLSNEGIYPVQIFLKKKSPNLHLTFSVPVFKSADNFYINKWMFVSLSLETIYLITH